MTIKNLIDLVNVPDFRNDKDCTNIDYGSLSDDCDTKTISLLEAIKHISLSIFSLAESENAKKATEEIMSLSCVISDLSDIAIATNKASKTSTELYFIKGEANG